MGKAAEIVDTSILTIEDAALARAEKANGDRDKRVNRNEQAFDDLTDWQNEDFVYVL